MADESLIVHPSDKARQVLNSVGDAMPVPEGWELLRPGDAALSRRIKKDGPSWTMIEKRGRKRFSQGIWAPADRIAALRAALKIERDDPSYQVKLDAGRARRAREQVTYAREFEAVVASYLDFDPKHRELSGLMAKAIADHAVPVGSGTVARTQRIPIEQRAEAATIAWMRHQTTAYDQMAIPREKGKRRDVRRMLAKKSKQLLDRYRRAREVRVGECPLRRALGVA